MEAYEKQQKVKEYYEKNPDKLSEYYQLRGKLIKKYQESDTDEYVYTEQRDEYEADMAEYEEALKDYKEEVRKYGKTDYSIEEYVIIRYIWPLMSEQKMLTLKNGQYYVFPEYIRGKHLSELINRPESIISFSQPYKDFLRINGLGRPDEKSIGGIRSSNDSDYNYRKFITAWVLKHYTTIYDDVQLED